ncbi:MAG: arsenate reductase family protein [Cryomorphaceae bacterium]
MKKFYYLQTCDTCKRILKELRLPEDVKMREIKSDPLTEKEVDQLATKAGSYEAIFSKRARKYRSLGLNERELSEADYKKYLLKDYTFLKRPVLETQTEAIAGNAKKQVSAMLELL